METRAMITKAAKLHSKIIRQYLTSGARAFDKH